MAESPEQAIGRGQLETREPAILQARLLREATEQRDALLKALRDRLECEQCHGSGTVYIQDAPDDAHGEPCDCDITARQVLDANGGGSLPPKNDRWREDFEELVEASIANLEACPNGDFCNDVTRVWTRLLEARQHIADLA